MMDWRQGNICVEISSSCAEKLHAYKWAIRSSTNTHLVHTIGHVLAPGSVPAQPVHVAELRQAYDISNAYRLAAPAACIASEPSSELAYSTVNPAR